MEKLGDGENVQLLLGEKQPFQANTKHGLRENLLAPKLIKEFPLGERGQDKSREIELRWHREQNHITGYCGGWDAHTRCTQLFEKCHFITQMFIHTT